MPVPVLSQLPGAARAVLGLHPAAPCRSTAVTPSDFLSSWKNKEKKKKSQQMNITALSGKSTERTETISSLWITSYRAERSAAR